MSRQPTDVIRLVGDDEFPPSVRELYRNPDVLAEGALMKHQSAWIRHIQEHALAVCPKGRRTGITYATAKDDTITAASARSAGGDNIYYVGDTKEKGLEFIGYCAAMAKVMAVAMAQTWHGVEVILFDDQQADGSSKKITSYRIRFASGFQIVALSSNPANIRGLQGIVNIDEAAFHSNVQAVLDAALALLIWGGRVRIISTHNGVQNPFNQLIKDARSGLNQFAVFEVYFDDAVENGLYERVCLVKGWQPTIDGKQQWYESVRRGYGQNRAAMLEELDGVPRDGGGVVLPTVLIEARSHTDRPVLRVELDDEFALKPGEYRSKWAADWIAEHLDPLLEKLDPTADHAFGVDYARHVDLASIAPVSTLQNLNRSYPFLIELRNVPTRQQEEILWRLIRGLPNFRKGALDATGPGAILAEYTADEFGHERIDQVMLSESWYRDEMPGFVDAFTDDTIQIPADAGVLADLRSLQRVNGIVRVPQLRQSEIDNPKFKRHGDSAISLALAWYASKQDVEVFESHRVRSNPNRRGGTRRDSHRLIKTTAGFGRGSI